MAERLTKPNIKGGRKMVNQSIEETMAHYICLGRATKNVMENPTAHCVEMGDTWVHADVNGLALIGKLGTEKALKLAESTALNDHFSMLSAKFRTTSEFHERLKAAHASDGMTAGKIAEALEEGNICVAPETD